MYSKALFHYSWITVVLIYISVSVIRNVKRKTITEVLSGKFWMDLNGGLINNL